MPGLYQRGLEYLNGGDELGGLVLRWSRLFRIDPSLNADPVTVGTMPWRAGGFRNFIAHLLPVQGAIGCISLQLQEDRPRHEKMPKTLILSDLGLKMLEAEEGIEPSHDGFANHCLTIWLLRRARGAGASDYVLAGRVSMPGFWENVASSAARA